MYSDEYDDTYDSDGMALVADAPTDERRPFVTPRVLQPRGAEVRGKLRYIFIFTCADGAELLSYYLYRRVAQVSSRKFLEAEGHSGQ